LFENSRDSETIQEYNYMFRCCIKYHY